MSQHKSVRKNRLFTDNDKKTGFVQIVVGYDIDLIKYLHVEKRDVQVMEENAEYFSDLRTRIF